MGSAHRTADGIKAGSTTHQVGGVVRHVDALGRVVIPVEIRKRLAIAVNEPIEIGVRGDVVVLSKPRVSCVFCGSESDLISYRDRRVCGRCRTALAGDVVSA
jgi:AbrB family transcriptional regulator, transcriptional pleiotropic regulator of transition state genes